MLRNPTLEKLNAMKLHGMAKALEEQFQSQESESLSFEDRIGLMVDQEQTERENRSLQLRLRTAKLRNNACLEDEELAIARADGRYARLMNQMARIDVIAIDDLGLSKLKEPEQRDLLEILEDRHDHHSTIVTSQTPVEHWHELMANPTLADTILDRLIHNAYKINLKGASMRKRKSKSTGSPGQAKN